MPKSPLKPRKRRFDNASHSGVVHVAFDDHERLGPREFIYFEAQYTPHQIAVYSFTVAVATPAQRSLSGGATAFPAPDFHRLKHASFAWRAIKEIMDLIQ